MTQPSPNTSLTTVGPDLANGTSTLVKATSSVLRELECSLHCSQRALLTRDLPALERATRDQTRLRRALEILGASSGPHPAKDISSKTREPGPPINIEPGIAASLRAAQSRVLYLGQVQAALLARERRWLIVLANLVAGPDASYGSPENQRSFSGHGGGS